MRASAKIRSEFPVGRGVCRIGAGIVLLACAHLLAPGGRAQTAPQSPSPGSSRVKSDLSIRNDSRVSASAAEIKSILLGDAGLLVELKRQIAKDATNRGQIVSDSDLADETIFDRLETDVEFRAAATALLRRYGYLVPKLNPASEAAKERDLLMAERTKWVAEREEEERRQAGAREQNEDSAEPASEQGKRSQSKRAQPAQEPGPRNPLNPPDLPTHSKTIPSEDFPEPGEFEEPDENDRQQIEPVSTPLEQTNSSPPSSAIQDLNADPLNADATQPAATSGLKQNFDRHSAGAESLDRGEARISEGARERVAQGTDYESAPAPQKPPLEMVRALTPYPDVPSLYDMYVQAVERPREPARFGMEVFRHGTRDSQLIPMDLPVGPDYVVGPGDTLALDLWGGVSQRLVRTVDREGRVSLPEVGPVLVSGKSLLDVQQSIQQTLRTQLRGVSADVSLARLRTVRIYEVGEVARPGAYDVSSLSTPLNALFAAGGPTERGSMRMVKHYRGAKLVETVDLYDLLLHGVRGNLERLEDGDTVQVPVAGPEVTIEGMVRRPAIYEVCGERNLLQVIDLAGGLLPVAVLRHIEVERVVDHVKQTTLSLDLADASGPGEVDKALAAFEVHDGDRIRIYPIAPYNQDSVFLEGHALRPGRYAFRAGMRVADVVSSYADLLPEPSAQYAEIIRLNPPDFHPAIEGFSLESALADPAHSPELRAMDTIRIFGRYDFQDPPSVSVLGDVRAPGTYRTTGAVRLSDAIHLAKGLSPDAEVSDAQVFRYLPDGEFKIFNVRLDLALAGDPSENITLEARDRVLVHKSPAAVEPASVYVQGEVANPGRYPLTANMRIADLVRVGGGLKPSADPNAADLTHYQWSADSKLTGEHQDIALAAALASSADSNLPLHNGDVLTIRQVAGWNDLGASVTLKGEVKHPGTYGIRPGERLSSLLLRAGGFSPGAYPYGAILQRSQVRDAESKAQAEILNRLRDAQTSLELLPETDSKQKEAKTVAIQQAQASIEQLSASPVVGRVTIQITSEINRWKNTPADPELRSGDALTIPKKPGWVMVSGQVYTPTAISYRPGRSAKWYLAQSGGPTQMGNKREIFVIRANGSVVSAKRSLFAGDSLSASLQPGDTVVVPERAIAGGLQWQSVLLTAQTASAIASTVFIALRY